MERRSRPDLGDADGTEADRNTRPLTKQEIQADFARAARNALDAGFDGVQILANYLYLISRFLNATTNLRKDEYGGSLESRLRFLFEIVESVMGEVEAQQVGVKISPMHEGGASGQRRDPASHRIRNSEAYAALVLETTTCEAPGEAVV
ncbi:hypothetical protein RBB73_11090 [Tunturiibacter empetritectus]|uniref:oxidoreductase n=1 Tax=Tunturiibacter empetritectus TaxID=3069691 RepID=UPI003D9B6CD5